MGLFLKIYILTGITLANSSMIIGLIKKVKHILQPFANFRNKIKMNSKIICLKLSGLDPLLILASETNIISAFLKR